MQCDYQIDDILRQTDEFLVYQATGADGGCYTLTRLKYPYEVLMNLRDGRFERALTKLKGMHHSCLRPITDGGIDPVDHQPWIATRAWGGKTVEELQRENAITPEQLQLIEVHAKSLIAAFVDDSGALDFRASEIVLSTAIDGQPIVTFSINYLVWFRDLAMGYPPGYKRDPKANLTELLKSLESSEAAPVSASNPLVTTPLVTAVAPATPATVAPKVLASAKGGGNGKAGLAIAFLCLLLGGGLWAVIKMREPKQPSVEEALVDGPTSAPIKKSLPETKVEEVAPPPSREKDPEPVAQKMVDPVPAPEPPAEALAKEPSFPARPSPGAMSEISAKDASALESNTGFWVIARGEALAGGKENTLSLKGSDLTLVLRNSSLPSVVGESITAIGYLHDSATLYVQNPSDIEIFVEVKTLPKKSRYTPEDEAQILTLTGETITLTGLVKNVKASGSGKTLYLVLNDTKPEFAASVRTRYAEDGLDLDYLRTFDGKVVTVTGKVRKEKGYNGGGRLLIEFRKKSDLALSPPNE